MQDPMSPYLPAPSEGDKIHALIRGLLGSIPGVGNLSAELFGLLVRVPVERRLQEWIEEVEDSLRSLYRRDSTIEAYLHSEVFLSVLLAATQAAVRTHRKDKRRLLAAAGRPRAAPSTTPPPPPPNSIP